MNTNWTARAESDGLVNEPIAIARIGIIMPFFGW